MQVEKAVKNRIIKLMEARGWYVKVTVGNAFQSGLPDLIAWHKQRGVRFIELKTPRGTYTPAQRRDFHLISAHSGHIWTLVGDIPLDDLKLSVEIEKLNGPSNWFLYL